MPELPEVEALRGFLVRTCVGRTVARTELAAFACLKTFTLPLTALNGLEVERDEYLGLLAEALAAPAPAWPSREEEHA